MDVNINMNIYGNLLAWLGLQTVVQLVHQWPSTSERPKNPVVVESTRLVVSTGLLNPEGAGSNVSEGMG